MSKVILTLAASAAAMPLIAAQAANAASPPAAQSFVNQSQHAMQTLERDKTLDGLLRRARGVLIMPSFGQGGFIVGGRGGEGLVLVHRNGTWSDPAFYHVGGINVGAQIGGAGGAVVMLLMSPNAVNDVMGGNNFSLNANAGLSVVDYSAKARAGWGRADIIVWSNMKGLYGGATVGISDVAQDQAENHAYYGGRATVRQIYAGTARNPGANALTRTIATA